MREEEVCPERLFQGENEEGRGLIPVDLRFAPFPPGPVENEEAVRVSPPEGIRGATVTRSVLREPIIVIVFGPIVRSREGERVRVPEVNSRDGLDLTSDWEDDESEPGT